jgi:glucokinase
MSLSVKSILIGVDVGGTKIRTGAMNPEGEIIGEPITVETGGTDESSKILERIEGSITSVIRDLDPSLITGIGLGVTGPLDTVTGQILECPQLPTMHFFPLRDRIIEKFGLPVFMDNDANALLLGESIWGAGKGSRTTLGFTLGTGLGCAIVVGKKLFTGANGMAGEIWPSPYREGTIEDLVSGNGVSLVFQGLTGKHRTAKEISTLARAGDKDAIETWNVFGKGLAFSVSWGINMIDPDIVIIGGSIADSMDLFYKSMDEMVKKYICPVPAAKTRIVKAELAENAGFIGAAGLVLQAME